MLNYNQTVWLPQALTWKIVTENTYCPQSLKLKRKHDLNIIMYICIYTNDRAMHVMTNRWWHGTLEGAESKSLQCNSSSWTSAQLGRQSAFFLAFAFSQKCEWLCDYEICCFKCSRCQHLRLRAQTRHKVWSAIRKRRWLVHFCWWQYLRLFQHLLIKRSKI